MRFIAHIDVMPLKNLLDPQGKAVNQTLKNLGYKETTDIRIGKHIELNIEAADENTAKQIAEEISRKVLSNQVMEYFQIKLKTE